MTVEEGGWNDGSTGNEPLLRVSVIVCTRNRAESLRTTLECLASTNRADIQAEIIVVDNASHDHTREIVASFHERMSVRYLHEPALGVFGKSHALNRALDAEGLGEIVAILDDDMSPHPDWLQGIKAICGRWPDKDIFTGSTFVIWPSPDLPGWAKKASLEGTIFSAQRFDADLELRDGGWFVGGHFWFRSRVLAKGQRFKDTWLTEPDFQLGLMALGFGAVAGPDAVVGHRVQPALLRRDVAMARAEKAGEKAWVRLQPYRVTVRQARLFHAHPWLARLFCGLNYLRWWCLYLAAFLYPSDTNRFEHRLLARERMAIAREYLRVADRVDAYSLWNNGRSGRI